MKISVIIPCRNDAMYLRRSIGSVKDQTVEAHEIIVVNDASDLDGGLLISEVCHEYRCRLIEHRVRKGPFGAMQAGADAATGDAVCFLGVDDEMHSEWLKMARFSIGNKNIAAVWSWATLNGTDELRGNKREQKSPLWPGPMYCGSGNVIRKNEFDEAGGFDLTGPCQAFADMDLMIRLAERWEVYGYRLPYMIVHQRPRSASTSRKECDVKAQHLRIIGKAIDRRGDLYAPHIGRIYSDAHYLYGMRAGSRRAAAREFVTSLRWEFHLKTLARLIMSPFRRGK